MIYKKFDSTAKRPDAFEEVSALFAANNIEMTDNMLKLMSPLMHDSKSFKKIYTPKPANTNKIIRFKNGSKLKASLK